MDNQPIGTIYTATSWNTLKESCERVVEIKEIDSKPTKWIFRGDKYRTHNYQDEVKYKEDKGGLCKMSLEKACDTAGIPAGKRAEREKDIIREFQRKLYLYTPHCPSRQDIIEWLALMQHHFAPTRLVDWTYSFHVAAYFALAELDCREDEQKKREVAEIWAINSRWFCDKAEQEFDLRELDKIKCKITRKRSAEYMDDLAVQHNAIVHHLIENPKCLVYAINPFRLNQRLTIQQGVFMLAGDISRNFMDNLQSELYSEGLEKNIYRVRLPVNTGVKCEMMKKLCQMNLSNATLFPGLDGFARSMRERLVFSLDDILYQKIQPKPLL